MVKAAADETPLTLAVLRNHIEKELMEEASLSPDAAAKVKSLIPGPDFSADEPPKAFNQKH